MLTTERFRKNGGVGTGYRCQSPSASDLEIIKEEALRIISAPLSTHPVIAFQEQTNKQDVIQKMSEIGSYNKHLGSVLAISGWRNVLFRTPSSPVTMKMVLDWACIGISSQAQWSWPLNHIRSISMDLQASNSPAAHHWTCQEEFVRKAVHLPSQNTVIFKRGRSTGLTAGKLGPIVPSTFRIFGVPGDIRHTCYLVTPDFGEFAQPGDSGAWCLNGNGELVGIVIGGEESSGTGLMIPIEVVFQDIERMLNLPQDSLKFP